MESGKDTVGKMIQYLSLPTHVQDEIGGFGRFVNGEYSLGLTPHISAGWQIRKFSTPIKQIASILTGIPVGKFEDQEFKKTFLGPEWDYWEYEWSGGYPEWLQMRFPSKEEAMLAMAKYQGTSTSEVDPDAPKHRRMTVRQFLQELGVECMRNNLHTNTWINAAFANYKCSGEIDLDTAKYQGGYMTAEAYNLQCPDWIFVDMRFPNELKAIKARGGKTIRINRFKSADMVAGPGGTHLHASETALDRADFDCIIDNTGTLSELLESVRAILARWKIIPVEVSENQ